MRTLKFRAWSKDYKDMVYDVGVTPDQRACWEATPGVMVCEDECLETLAEVINHEDAKNDVLMQYTGLKDKNGKEIYEHDVVNWWHNGKPREINRVIEWSDKNWGYCLKFIRKDAEDYNPLDPVPGQLAWTEYGYLCHAINSTVELEVVGNVYENPNLLT